MARTKEFDPDAAVEAAMQLFWSQGYATTTPAHLVDRLGIGRGSLYNAFTSKHRLYELALRRYQETSSAALIDVLEGDGTPRERLRAALDLVIAESLADQERRGCMITNAAVELAGHDEAVRVLVQRTLDQQRGAFRAVIQEGRRAGDIAPDRDAAALTDFFVTTLNGIRVMARVDPDLHRLGALADTAMRTL